MSIRLRSGGSMKSAVLDGRVMAGQALPWCLLMSSLQVSSLLGAIIIIQPSTIAAPRRRHGHVICQFRLPFLCFNNGRTIVETLFA